MATGPGWLAAWAKSFHDESGALTHWLPLYQHLDDAAGVAGLLVDQWVSPQALRYVSRELPAGEADVRRLVSWLAGVHDVGKASPAFAVQEPTLADHMRRYGLGASPRLASDPERSSVPHTLVGHRAVRSWLVDEVGFSTRRGGTATQLASIVGSHHGVPPEHTRLRHVREHVYLAGSGEWDHARMVLLERATRRAGGREVLASYDGVQLSKPSLVLLSAVVILADWIASNSYLFRLEPVSTLDESPSAAEDERTGRRVARGWAKLALPTRWQASQPTGGVDQRLRTRFGLATAGARPVQRAAVEAAAQQHAPGMLVVEAPMGEGKTEAALLAVEVLAYRSGADGCLVALPTQATSDAVFTRVVRWLRALPSLDGSPVSVNLVHGKAHLNETYRGMAEHGGFHTVGDDAIGTVVHKWLNGRKKATLAAFAVGTIDQVLFAGLKSRHLMLRHLALAGKVVVIDEVHAYDVYMAQYLQRVVHWLGVYGVPVVLLSATLPAQRRAELLRAYDSGRTPGRESTVPEDPGYPVVLGSGGASARPVAPSTPDMSVRLDRLEDDADTLVTYLRHRLRDGGCAAVVRNTVRRVQDTADRLITEFGPERVTVAHSRFLACDRARIDRELVRRFGPPGGDIQRPDWHIVVASQVVEQSLDVDFDLLVTDLAPVDLVLQRIGRSHRHPRRRPGPVGHASCAIVGVDDWEGVPVHAVAGSRAVYSEHTLLRAAALLVDRDEVTVPADIALLVQRAYDEQPLGPPEWQPTMQTAQHQAAVAGRRRAEAARAFLLEEAHRGDDTLIGWTRASVGEVDEDPDSVAQVRDSGDSLEVLVVQRDTDGGLVVPDWIEEQAGSQIPLDQEVPDEQARVIAACSLRLPRSLCHPGVIDDVIDALEDNRFASFAQSPMLTGELVLVLDEHRHATVRRGAADFALTYDPYRGLLHA